MLLLLMSVLVAGISTDGIAAANPNASILDATHKIYFTASAPDGIPLNEPSKEFSCSDSIYVVLESKGLVRADDYALQVIWTDPTGVERERTEYKFSAFDEEIRIWAWLRLHRGTGATLMSFIDSAAGMREFIGEWRIKVSINDVDVGEPHFSVIC